MTNGKAMDSVSPSKQNICWSASASEPLNSPITQNPFPRDPEGQKLSTDVYLGSTSYSAVFTEGQSHPQLQDLPDADQEETQAACQAKLKLGLTAAKIQEGAEVLVLLSEIQTSESGFNRWYKVQCVAALLPFVGECINMVTQRMKRTPFSKAALRTLSERIFVSTSKDLIIQSTTVMQDLPSMLMGENLRWDTVGLMLTAAGLSAISLDEVIVDPDDEELREVNWKKMARKMLTAGNKCISFCEEVDSLNDVTVWLIMMNYILHTQVEGDAGLTTAIFALGLHQESKEPVRTPFFLVELRRKTFWVAYNSDKNFATFLGRPPMINSNFCSRQMPLDLEDTQLALNGSDLQEALGKLDTNGWNTVGRVDRSTWLRTSILCCKFREEILELSLGSSTFGLHERARDIIRRQKEAYHALPSMLQDRSDRWVLERSTAENFFQLSKHIDPVYNEFLLHRTLVKRLRADPADLVRVSRSMLSCMLVLCGNRHRQGFYANDLPWLIALYGLPPAGVLALELLRQFSDRSHGPDPNFPRSDIIQKLSILISDIGCIVRPTNGNYGICGQAKKMLQAILDTVLAPAPMFAPTPEPVGDMNTDQNQDDVVAAGNQDPMVYATLESNQIWFDNTNFDLDFWNNLEDHPLLVWPEGA